MNDGGFLFPQDESDVTSPTGLKRHGGITVRKFFAAILMRELLDSPFIIYPQDEFHQRCAKNAYRLADLLIKEGETNG